MKLYNPSHPGRVCWHSYFEDEESNTLSVAETAEKLGLTEKRLEAFLEGSENVDAELALRLATGFGTKPQFWLKIQLSYDLWQAEQHFDANSVRPVID